MATDRQIVDATASFWVANGGDADGFLFLMYQIEKAIRAKEQVNERRSSSVD